MRLQLVGGYTLEEFQKAVSKIIKDFQSNDIDSVRGINIYLRTCIDGREIHLTDGGNEVEHLIYDFGRRQQIAMTSSDLSKVSAHVVNRKLSEEE